MESQALSQQAGKLAANAQALAAQANDLASQAATVTLPAAAQGPSTFIFLLIIFVLACFVGYYVVWRVTPALHSPLMAVTNAISSVIIVGAMLAAGAIASGWATAFGVIAVILASVNIFGGFLVTQRMLAMFKKKQKA